MSANANLSALISGFELENDEEEDVVDAEENAILTALLKNAHGDAPSSSGQYSPSSSAPREEENPFAQQSSSNANLDALVSGFDCEGDNFDDAAESSILTALIDSQKASSLTSNHAQLEASSQKSIQLQPPKPQSAQLSLAAVFDPAFGIRIRNPKITLHALNSLCQEMRKVRVSSLRNSGVPTGKSGNEWVTMAVIVSKTECRKSSNDKEYVIWQVSDLADLQDVPIKVLLFGDCVKQHWKLQVGMTVLLVNAAGADDETTKQVTLKVARSAQVMDIGFCPDLGTCKALRVDGNLCTVHVNVTQTEYCVYHMQNAARKLSARRGTFGSLSNIPPKAWRSTRPAAEPEPAGLKTANRTGPPKKFVKPVPRHMKLSKTLPVTGGSKSQPAPVTPDQLIRNRSSIKRPGFDPQLSATPPVKRVKSMKEFIYSRENEPNLGSRARLGFVDLASPEKQMKSRVEAQEQLKIKKAAEILRRSGTKSASQPAQRIVCRNVSNDSVENASNSKKSGTLTDEQILALMKKKSRFDDEANKALLERQNRYFADREVEEKVETNATSLMEIKNCKVVTCKACDYTSVHQSEYCRNLGHLVKRHTADKRFFRCKNCKTRISSFTLMPTKPCQNCLMINYERVAMRDERKVHEEKLLLRGEERKFIN